MLYALKEKGTNIAIAIIDESLISWFTKNLPMFELVEVESIGSRQTTLKKGSVNSVAISTKDDRQIYMLKSHSESLTDSEAMALIRENENAENSVNGTCFTIGQKVIVHGITDEDSNLNNLTGIVTNPFGFGETKKGYVGLYLDKKGVATGDKINVHGKNIKPNIKNFDKLLEEVKKWKDSGHSDNYTESVIYAHHDYSTSNISEAVRYYNSIKE